MPCDSKEILETLIQSDRRFIRTCWWIYAATLTFSIVIAVALELSVRGQQPTASLWGLLANGMMFPVMPKHMQRAGAVRVMKYLQEQCGKFDASDERCKRIGDNVDSLLRSRGAA